MSEAASEGEPAPAAGRRLSDHAEQVRKTVSEGAATAREWAGDRAGIARDWALDQSDVLRDTVQTRPIASVGASTLGAFVAGLVVGVLLARR